MKVLIMTILGSLTIFFAVVAQAQIQLSSCEIALMSEPNCVNRINAASFCKTMGDSLQTAQMAVNCFARVAPNSKPTKEVMMLCLAGWSTSTRPSDNATLCK